MTINTKTVVDPNLKVKEGDPPGQTDDARPSVGQANPKDSEKKGYAIPPDEKRTSGRSDVERRERPK